MSLSELLGSATAWPVAARGQQLDRVWRIGVLMTIAECDPEAQSRPATFRARLEQLGWTDGRNVQIDIRFAGAGRVDPVRCNKRLTAVFDPDILVPSPDGTIE